MAHLLSKDKFIELYLKTHKNAKIKTAIRYYKKYQKAITN